ncbi:MAG: type III-B CRISPR module RAMP protein Cmr1 [Fimbriimonadaceae bacterium]|nr:type III-B CRISPR module RAMP protein Cmr1 [Fimbriimonadaceae bacterium]
MARQPPASGFGFTVRTPSPDVVVQIELITPMLGGGAEAGTPDPHDPFRGPAIRGALRWWWRRVVVGACPSVNDLVDKEAKLWGSAEAPGAVEVRVVHVTAGVDKTVDRVGAPQYAYGLYGNANTIAADGPRYLVSGSATLEVSGADADVKAALALWLWLGGVGARTRRGFGSLGWSVAKGALPDPKTIVRDRREGPVRFTGLEGARVFVATGQYAQARAAWAAAVALYAAFRRGELPDAAGRPRHGADSHSRWPEANVIRRRQGADQTPEAPLPVGANPVPRARLGLPIGFVSAGGTHRFGNRVLTLGVAGEEARWPSPAITKAVPDGQGGFEALLAVLGAGDPNANGIRTEMGKVPQVTFEAAGTPAEWFNAHGFVTKPAYSDDVLEKLADYAKDAGWREIP